MFPSHPKSNERVFKISFIDLAGGHLGFTGAQRPDILFLPEPFVGSRL